MYSCSLPGNHWKKILVRGLRSVGSGFLCVHGSVVWLLWMGGDQIGALCGKVVFVDSDSEAGFRLISFLAKS